MATQNISTNFKSSSSDVGQKYLTKDYVMDVYPTLVPGRKTPKLFTWGYNSQGSLGLSNLISYSSPIQIGSLTTWKQVSAGSYNGAAIKTDGTLWGWGDNQSGQVGNNVIDTDYSSPVQVGALTNWKQLASSVYNTFATKTDGTLWAWGDNMRYQLGIGSTDTFLKATVPIQVGTLTNWRLVSCGYRNVAAIKTDGTLWTWGMNQYGQIGNSTYWNVNSSIAYSSPNQVGALTDWRNVGIGYQFMAGIKTNGTIWSWGYNNNGALGNNTTVNYSSPIQIGSSTDWKNISLTNYNIAAIKTNGTIWTWGPNGYGQLGNGTTLNYSSPIQVGLLTNWKNVYAGRYYTAAIKTDGTLWMWGANDYGQLGVGNTIYYSSPIQIGSLSTWKQIACGYWYCFGITDGYY